MSVLLALSSAAVVSSWRLAAVTDDASAAVRIAEQYQEARYLAVIQHAEHETALGNVSDEAARSAHRKAAARFAAVLNGLRSTDPGGLAVLSDIIAEQARYLDLTDQFFTLARAGNMEEAATLHEEDIEPLELRIMGEVEELAAKNRAASTTAHAYLRRQADALKIGTPVALTAGLLLLWLFSLVSLVTSSYRRTVEFQALHDSLTELPNRALFRQRCEQALDSAGRTTARPAVLLLDLNEFKQVNDTLGHHIGDQLLVDVAARLRSTCRANETVARLGGDEFAVLLSDGGATGAQQAAERITEAFTDPIVLASAGPDDVTLTVAASIGIALAEADSDVPTLLRHADTAMYTCKRLGLDWATYTSAEDRNDTTGSEPPVDRRPSATYGGGTGR